MTSEPLADRLRRLTWPEPYDDQPDVEPGQLWRAEWTSVVALVVILEVPGGRQIRAAGATAGSTGDDHATMAATTRGLHPVVWTSAQTWLPTFTLDHRIDNLTDESFARVRSIESGGTPGDWASISNDLDDRRLEEVDLLDALAALHSAEWVPTADPGASTLATQAATAGLKPSDVAAALNVTPGDARRLLQGHRAASSEERVVLTDLLGAEPGDILNLDEDLVACLDRPEFRPRLQLVADREHDGDEGAARRAVATRTLALAARHRERGTRNWASMLRDALDAD